MNRESHYTATQRYRKTEKGLVTNLYNKMKERNTVSLTLKELHEFSVCQKFKRLYSEWVKSGYLKKFKPSIDRINKNKGYVAGNIHWLTWEENRYKQTMERRSRKGKVAKMKDGKIIEVFSSQREARLKENISQGNLSQALCGIRRSCAGYNWKYLNSPTQ